jgi:hypothetical protein
MTDEIMAVIAEDEATEPIAPLAGESQTAAERAGSPGFLARLRARFAGMSAAQDYTTERLIALSRAIERHPDAAVNYVLRGELFLKMGEHTRAADDFQGALILTDAQLQQDDWGLVAQAVQERALAGLRMLSGRED